MKLNPKTNTFPGNRLKKSEIETAIDIANGMREKNRKAALLYIKGAFYCSICRQQIMDEKKECLCGVEKKDYYDTDPEFEAYLKRIKAGKIMSHFRNFRKEKCN